VQIAYSLNSNEHNIEIIITDRIEEEHQREKTMLNETLNDYRENGNKNFTLMTDDFWQAREARLIQRHKVS